MPGMELLPVWERIVWLAQLPLERPMSREIADDFSGSQGFLVLIAGVLLALAFQLLLTTFFIALGISYSDSEEDANPEQNGSLDDRINRVGTVVGLRTVGTISISLFGACFLAIKLSLTPDLLLGAILGLVIWAAYFSLILGVSFTTAGSLVGKVVNTATSGLQGIVGTAAVVIGAKNVTKQVVSTADAAATTVRQELSSAVDPATTRKAIDDYLQQLRLPEAEHQDLQDQFRRLATTSDMKALARENHLRQVGRQNFIEMVNSRTDFSKQNINQAVDQWETFWQQLWGEQETSENGNGLVGALQSAHPSQPQPDQLTPKLEELIDQTSKRQAQQQDEAKQKVAETAAWWLFGTAFFSAAASVVAGAIAVRGNLF